MFLESSLPVKKRKTLFLVEKPLKVKNTSFYFNNLHLTALLMEEGSSPLLCGMPITI